MRKFKKFESPARQRRARGLSMLAVLATTVSCALDKIPEDLRPTVEPRIPLAIGVAERSAAQCAALTDEEANAEPSGAASPAVGTALATDLAVVEILVRCVRAVDAEKGDDASPHPDGHFFDFPSLRAAPRRGLAPSPALVYDTRVSPGDLAFERVRVPSMYSDLAQSADITATAPIPGGGSVEVTVAVKQ